MEQHSKCYARLKKLVTKHSMLNSKLSVSGDGDSQLVGLISRCYALHECADIDWTVFFTKVKFYYIIYISVKFLEKKVREYKVKSKTREETREIQQILEQFVSVCKYYLFANIASRKLLNFFVFPIYK